MWDDEFQASIRATWDDWQDKLPPDDMRFLESIAIAIAKLARDDSVRARFQDRLRQFASQYAAFRTAREAWDAKTWQAEMGTPTNPLGTIWPYTYGTGWPQREDDTSPRRGILLLRPGPRPEIEADCALLVVIHDKVMRGPSRIDDGLLPHDLAQKIWCNLLNDIDGEGSQREYVIRRRQVEQVLARVTQDVKPGPQYISSKKLDQKPTGTGPSGETPARNQTTQEAAVSREMNETEIQQIREYADRVAELLQPMEMPSLERTWESEPLGMDDTSRVAQRIAAEWDRILHPLKVEYRKKVVDVLGDSNWEPIADIFEHCASQTLVRLDGWKQDILDHTDPASKHIYWLECRDGKFGPNPGLKNRIENLEGKLRRRAERAEQALNQGKANMRELDQQAPKPDIPGLIDRLKTYKRANEAGGEEPVKKTMECLKQYAGSAEELWAFLDGCKDKYGASANMKNAIDAVKGARMSWGGGGFYPALWNMLATKEVISELERWLAQKGRLQSESLQPPVGSMLQEETRPKDCTHSDDFSSVVWYGVPHHFTATQASCVALLWTEWEKDPQAGLGLREKFIGEKIGSSNENYRLAHTFRHKGRPHPAWGTMIHSKGDGFFCLAGPEAANKTKKRRKK